MTSPELPDSSAGLWGLGLANRQSSYAGLACDAGLRCWRLCHQRIKRRQNTLIEHPAIKQACFISRPSVRLSLLSRRPSPPIPTEPTNRTNQDTELRLPVAWRCRSTSCHRGQYRLSSAWLLSSTCLIISSPLGRCEASRLRLAHSFRISGCLASLGVEIATRRSINATPSLAK